ncbi:MAG: endo-1,4-beta-xylanase [Lachnospiraceae bacterium]|nr:endo-1,4-beta-xylanase [Lachnospiraceae bacterium]
MKRMMTAFLCSALLLTACADAAPAGSSVSDGQSGTQSEEQAEDQAEIKGLKDVFAEHGIKAGCCVSGFAINSRNIEPILLQQFNSVTAENSMKPDAILSKADSLAEGTLVVKYGSEAQSILAWAKENGLSMRGHTLIWYNQTPDWIFHEDFDTQKPFVGRDEMLSRMESLIKGNFEELDALGYTDLFYAYDVVNEGWMEDGTMRKNNWYDIIGEDYIWYAFYYADKYAPESIDLYYNDYNEQYKADSLCRFVNTLVDEDGRYLIDGIGLQAHLFTDDDLNIYLKGVDKLATTGLKLQVTELDLGLGSYGSPKEPSEDMLKEQGRYYYELINGLLERADAGTINMDAIVFWGFSDLTSWRAEYSPMLFDKTFQPKYAYYGAVQEKDKAGYE